MTLKDQRGSVSILALFMIVCVFAIGALAADAARHFCIKVAVKNKLNIAARSAAAQVNPEQLKEARLVIDGDAAFRVFSDTLKVNLLLDNSLSPLPGSMLDGPAQVVYFKVVNPEETPFSYSYGNHSEIIDRAAVAAIISFPVKSGLLARMAGSPEITTMYCRATAAPELTSRRP